MSPKDFKEARYTESDWFSTFTLGHDDPGVYNWIDDGEKELGCALGYTENSIEYFINDWRYRDKIVPAPGQDAAFGCSYTFGYGVNDPWPSMLGVANLGQNGASNDQITRLAITYCKHLRPERNLMCYGHLNLDENMLESGGLEKFRSLSKEAIEQELKSPTWISGYTMLNNDAIDHHNYQKNKLCYSVFVMLIILSYIKKN
jgi:hypothetical protein